ncbi:MAG: uroporphyrinogen-III C-methyltransferase [Sulfuritalea sp.]|nr:uroporphyrinogen-III C-methyltransferase [Sulfuritalea sp.]MCF8183743.1 uroporphyrinogen-III C-methyltransferase [Polynucleobacter sp.]
MNTPTQTESPPVDTPPVDTPPVDTSPADTPPVAASSGSPLRNPAVIVLLLAIVAVVALWADGRRQIAGLQQEFARRLADGETLAKEGSVLVRSSQEALAALQAKVGALEAKLAETQSQAVALEAMYQEISSTRDERVLVEVEQAVAIAMQQLQFAGNVEAALIALQGAEARLARSVLPQFQPARNLIARDIARLKATPGANIGSLSLKIESVVVVIDSLPLAYEQRPKAEPVKRPSPPSDPASADYWRAIGADLWREIRQMVRVERIEDGEPALLAPSQSYFLRENLKLRLLSARLALLQRDGRIFREEIRQAREHLDRYFDGRAKPVQAAQATLKALAATDVSFELPGLAETLASLRNLKFAHERGAAGAAR